MKGLVIRQKGKYSHDFADNTLLVCSFRVDLWFSCIVDTPLNLKQIFELSFSVDVRCFLRSSLL